ncbi:hypothetical protein Cgig2_025300 [Carnegiea gigantea]|uniref:Myb/SANT-like domain-containing protein n=1 Tax=Carnegiea gigantea TaxID=171969 RepID=A0A9Q1GN85_9CARY|nr:hypothetical protein Cgig2_025300 [Carnegiea gigantea]
MKDVNEEKKTQFRWLKPMSKELLAFLANEVQKGNRPNNSFKSSSYVSAANAISKKFNVKCLPKHIDNDLKIVKNAWVVISKLRDKESGFGWDDNLKMITASPTLYSTYTEVNPTYEKYLNKKIDMYDEMAVVVGKDVHSHENTTNLEEKGNGDSEIVKNNDKQSISSAPLESRKSRKRTCDDDLELQNICT